MDKLSRSVDWFKHKTVCIFLFLSIYSYLIYRYTHKSKWSAALNCVFSLFCCVFVSVFVCTLMVECVPLWACFHMYVCIACACAGLSGCVCVTSGEYVWRWFEWLWNESTARRTDEQRWADWRSGLGRDNHKPILPLLIGRSTYLRWQSPRHLCPYERIHMHK